MTRERRTKKMLPWRRGTRIRIKMIAAQRGLSDEEIAKALNCGTEAILAFARKHEVSLDWLIDGELWGLLKTVRKATARARFRALSNL